MANKRPALLFYPGDWLRNTALRSCSMEARGLWIDMLCFMHNCTPYGYLKVNNKVILIDNLTHMVGVNLPILTRLLQELIDAGVCFVSEEGAYYSKRMVEDEDIRTRRAAGGHLGGNPALKKQGKKTKKQPTEDNQKVILEGYPSLANATTTINSNNDGNGNDGLKENNTNNINIVDDDVVNLEDNHKVNLTPPLNGFHDIEHLLEVYFTANSMIRTREQVCMANHMDMNVLRDWGEAFNRFLLMEGTTIKQKKDWGSHFKNWLNLQDKNKNPTKLFNEKSVENGKPESKSSNHNGNLKGHQPFSMESAVRKADKLFGKDGNT